MLAQIILAADSLTIMISITSTKKRRKLMPFKFLYYLQGIHTQYLMYTLTYYERISTIEI